MGDSPPATPILDTQLFRDAFNASPIGIAVENLDGQPLFVNPAFCRFLGFTEEELRRKHCVDFSPKEDAEKDWALFQQLRAGSIDHYQLEKRYFRRDGSLVWGSLSISLLNSRPSPLVIAIVEDISALKTAEEAQFRHAAIVESSEDAIVSKNLDGIITSWSAGAERIFGYPEAEVIGHPITIIFPPDLKEEENKILETLRAGGRLEHYETVRVTKAGKRVGVSLSIYPIKDLTGKIEGISKIAHDITDRKRAEEALRESEERLRLAVQAGTMFAYSWDAATDVIERSGESAEILGVKSDQAATGAAISAMVHPDDKQRLEVALSALNVENPTLRITYRIMRPDGVVKWLERNSRAYFDGHGKLKRIVGMIADITDRKLADEARFRHAAIVESSEDAIASVTLDGVIASWNEGAEHIYGYSAAEAVGKSVSIVIPPELPDQKNEILKTLRAGGRIERFETVRVTKTGKRINVSLSISPIKDSSGAIVALAGIARDISDRKRREETLQEYERVVENAEEMIAVVDREYRYLIANRQFLKLRNKTQKQVVGHFVHEVLNEGVFEAEVKPRLDECFQGKVVRYEMKYIYPELGERDVLVSYFPIEGVAGIDRVACILQDMTERKQAEESLRELNRALEEQTALLQSHEELLKTFVKNVPAGVAMFDRDMRYLQVSDRWCTYYSLDSLQVLGRSHYDLFPDLPQHYKTVHRRALEGETLRAEEDRWDREDGTIRWARWEVRPWRKPCGIIGGILIFVEDITHQKQAEDALSGMTRKLIESQEQERSRIGRELHDDINQRLAMLAVELEQPHDPSEFQNRVQRLREELRQISDDVQALSHDLHSTKLKYLGVVAGMKSWCKEFTERQKMNVDFKSDVRSVLPLDIGVPLFRVLQEALQNALKHSGGKRIEVQLREDSGEIHLIVSDSGRGFDVEAALQGKGLGLTSMRERVRLVNGMILIESKPMRGTTIHVRVPLALGHEAQRAAG